MNRVAEGICWFKTPVYALVTTLLLYVLVTLCVDPPDRDEAPWVMAGAAALAYVFACLSAAHYMAARHFQRKRQAVCHTCG